LAFLAARAHCWLMVNLLSTRTPRSLSAELQEALRRKTFPRALRCHHSERGAGKTHGQDANASRPRSPAQAQDAFSSCSLKGVKTTQVVYTMKAPVTTALLYQLSHAAMDLQKPPGFPSPTPSLSSTHKFFCIVVTELTAESIKIHGW